MKKNPKEYSFHLFPFFKKKLYGPFYIDRVHLEETASFKPRSPQEFQVLIWSTLEGQKTKSILEQPSEIGYPAPWPLRHCSFL